MTAQRAVQLVAVSFGLLAAPPFIAMFFWSASWVSVIGLTSATSIMLFVGLLGQHRWARRAALVWAELTLFICLLCIGFTINQHGATYLDQFLRNNVSGSGVELIPYFAVVGAITIWQRRVLRRTDVKTLFEPPNLGTTL